MLMAHGLKRTVWIAPVVAGSNPRTYGTPVAYELNWQSLSSGADQLAFGPTYKDYRRVVAGNADVDNIHRFDKAWMDTTPADLTDTLAADADFWVYSVDPGAGGVAEVLFKRVSADG